MATEHGRKRSISICMQQGVGACEGRLRSNNRAMVMALTLDGLTKDEAARWICAFRTPSIAQATGFEIEVELLHSDYSSIGSKSGSRRFPDSLNLVKFDGSILRTETDVLAAPGNTFVISTLRTPQLLLQDRPVPLELRDLVRASAGAKTQVEISIKLATNITSKAHSGRHFVFRVNARELNEDQEELTSFWGVTGSFELFAKPTTTETSSEVVRRHASAHCLASLASLASMGLQACEGEDCQDDTMREPNNSTLPNSDMWRGQTHHPKAEAYDTQNMMTDSLPQTEHMVMGNSCKRAKTEQQPNFESSRTAAAGAN